MEYYDNNELVGEIRKDENFSGILAQAKRPMVVLGSTALQRGDNVALFSLAARLGKNSISKN
jgi:hypothetical protein